MLKKLKLRRDKKMNMRNIDIPKILNGKTMTGRDVSFRIRIRNNHNFLSTRKYGSFGKADIKKVFIKKIGDLTANEIKMLGYSSIDEYLAEPFNKGLTVDSEKKWIIWSNFRPNWEVIDKIGILRK